MTVSVAQQDPGLHHDSALALRIGAMVPLTPAERAILWEVAAKNRHLPAQMALCADRKPVSPMTLISGWACYKRLLPDGRRQIIRFLLPGDTVGSLLHPGRPASNAAMSLTPVNLGDARPLQLAYAAADPALAGLSDALQRIDFMDELALGDQIVRLGRQTAYERVVHLVLEFYSRLSAVGQVRDNSFTLPLTQEVLADALGLSVVHINRTLQQVRRDRLFDMRGGQVTLRQPELMQAVADWIPPAP